MKSFANDAPNLCGICSLQGEDGLLPRGFSCDDIAAFTRGVGAGGRGGGAGGACPPTRPQPARHQPVWEDAGILAWSSRGSLLGSHAGVRWDMRAGHHSGPGRMFSQLCRCEAVMGGCPLTGFDDKPRSWESLSQTHSPGMTVGSGPRAKREAVQSGHIVCEGTFRKALPNSNLT